MKLTDVDVLIDQMELVTWYHVSDSGELIEGANSKHHDPLYKAEDVYAVLRQAPLFDPNPRLTTLQGVTYNNGEIVDVTIRDGKRERRFVPADLNKEGEQG